MKIVRLRFYEELNDFLPLEKRKVIRPGRIEQNFTGKPSVKDMIESLGVPHTEVDLILVNGKSVAFSYLVNDKDEISVYPVFESLDISDVQHLRPKPLRESKFVLDVHLGKLARYMRMLGFDSIYKNNYEDDELVSVSLNDNRTILTRDREILKRNEVDHGYWVRNENAERQLKEIVERFQLRNQIKEFTRCIECNSILEETDKQKVIDRIPQKVNEWYNRFFICQGCKRIYWEGSHYEKMTALIKKLKNTLS